MWGRARDGGRVAYELTYRRFVDDATTAPEGPARVTDVAVERQDDGRWLVVSHAPELDPVADRGSPLRAPVAPTAPTKMAPLGGLRRQLTCAVPVALAVLGSRQQPDGGRRQAPSSGRRRGRRPGRASAPSPPKAKRP